MLNENLLLYGHEELPPAPLTLRAGRLGMLFEPDTGFVRYVRAGDTEVVRCIYAVVRDGNWNTIPWKLSNLRCNVAADSFSISFDVRCSDGSVIYAWKGAINGTADSHVSFEFDGVAESDFQRNRIGICLLHPAECAGRECMLAHNDGTTERTLFPKEIAPWQPLKDVRAITTTIESGARATIEFDGDIFETEDQRNYGDASFKTYSTPQDLPKPVPVRKGDRVRQTVTISLSEAERVRAAVAYAKPPHVSCDWTLTAPITNIGFGLPRDGAAMTDAEVTLVRALKPRHLRADIFPSQADAATAFQSAVSQAAQLGVPLHVALHLGQQADAELKTFAAALAGKSSDVALWSVQRQGESFTSAETLNLARHHLSALAQGSQIAAVATPFFTELNRNRPDPSLNDLACFPYAPQVHLTDRYTLIENVADVAQQIESAAKFLNKPVVVAPISLKRAEPKAGRGTASGELPPTVDARQSSLFGAAWTVAHLSHLLAPRLADRVHSATYFETVGWRGLMERATGSALPARFFSLPGGVFPLYHVFAALSGAERVATAACSRPIDAAALGWMDSTQRAHLLVANLSFAAQEVTVEWPTPQASALVLNASTTEAAMRDPAGFRSSERKMLRAQKGVLTLQTAPYEVTLLSA